MASKNNTLLTWKFVIPKLNSQLFIASITANSDSFCGPEIKTVNMGPESRYYYNPDITSVKNNILMTFTRLNPYSNTTSIQILFVNKDLAAFTLPINLSNSTFSSLPRIIGSDDSKVAFVTWQDGSVKREIMMKKIDLEK
jgi:hypothetical protein